MSLPEEQLDYVRECLDRIERYTRGGKQEFLESTLVQDAVLRNLETLSDAVKDFPPSWGDRFPKVPWIEFKAYRNLLAHQYLTISLSRVWDVLVEDLPLLREAVRALLKRPERG